MTSKNKKQPSHAKEGMTTNPLRLLTSWVAWPLLFTSALVLTNLGMKTEYPVVCFNLVYLAFAFCIYLLERAMPHEEKWQEDDKQTFANLAHTALSKGMVQVMVVVATIVGLAGLVQPEAGQAGLFWPHEWPMIAQALLGLIIAEFGLYWAHRLAHEVPFLWRFHAVHHSVTRLWFINTGRFHFIDSIWSIVLGMPLLFILGAPQEVFLWVSAVTAFIGMLTHCNIEMRFGVLNYIFNTPGLHRWHHSKDIREGNKNYGENFVLWDIIFGTFFNPDRRPPVDIGIDGYMPERFVEQLTYPFKPEEEREQPSLPANKKS